MLRVSVDTLLRVTGGELLCGDIESFATDLVVDSRLVSRDCIFVALPGERSDGHDHLRDAMTGGASVIVVTQDRSQMLTTLTRAVRRGIAVIRVEDGLSAIQEIATWHRSRLVCPVIGITGSTGKTTTKELVRSVLSTKLNVVANVGNRNNELGTPLTVLSAGTDTDVLVVEMGMRGAGQIARLAQIAHPTMGVVTNVGPCHIELMGDQDSVAAAKEELLQAIPDDGVVFINADDPYCVEMAGRSHAQVVTYGLSEGSEVRATGIEVDSWGVASFDLSCPQGEARVRLSFPGAHNVSNALAAAAIGLRLAVPFDSVVIGLESASGPSSRMQTLTAPSGTVVIDDSYNANPASMKAAVDTLARMTTPGRRIAVLGDMAELGTLTELAHFEIGELVARAGLELLIAVGPRASRIADGARAEGMSDDAILCCADGESAADLVEKIAATDDIVLVKASRVMQLESVVERIVSPRVG